MLKLPVLAFTIFLGVLLGFLSMDSHCQYIQEFSLRYRWYTKSFNMERNMEFNITVTTNLSDIYGQLLGLDTWVDTVCYRGMWAVFSSTDYAGTRTFFDGTNGSTTCKNVESQLTKYQSVNFFGPQNTSENALRFYSGTNLSGKELLIDVEAYSGISTSAFQSLLMSGTENWRFFEGELFNGTSVCIPAPENTLQRFNNVTQVNLPFPKVGSVLRGTCEEACKI